jgi:hypothetical protein
MSSTGSYGIDSTSHGRHAGWHIQSKGLRRTAHPRGKLQRRQLFRRWATRCRSWCAAVVVRAAVLSAANGGDRWRSARRIAGRADNLAACIVDPRRWRGHRRDQHLLAVVLSLVLTRWTVRLTVIFIFPKLFWHYNGPEKGRFR